MITLRTSRDRRHVKDGVRDTRMTFDPGSRADPFPRGFRALESLDEEMVAPEMGLVPCDDRDIEIITYVRQGTLAYHDGWGNLGRLDTGEFQHTSSRGAVSHSATNGSFTDYAQVFQARITPDRTRVAPSVEKKRFSLAERMGTLRLVGSPGGGGESLRIHQDVWMYSSVLLVGTHLIHELDSGRGAWLHVVKGRILLRDHCLRTGDGAAFFQEAAVSFTAQRPSEILLFDIA